VTSGAFRRPGSGTSLSGGLCLPEGGLVTPLRLNRIVRLTPRRLAVVEPGVINLDVSKAAAPFGLYYAPDPSSQPICTIGGNLANAGGAHCPKYGMTSNHILGLESLSRMVKWFS
jgi:glycolate oxidase